MKTFSEYRESLNAAESAHGNPMQAVLLAYLAGIIDGEGTIRINVNGPGNTRGGLNPHHTVAISVGMVEKKVPDLLKKAFGGSVREERVPERRSIWRWAVTGNRSAEPVLESLLPYLFVKREQAGVALLLIRGWVAPFNRKNGVGPQELRRREDLCLRMKKLNLVGAAATTEREGI